MANAREGSVCNPSALVTGTRPSPSQPLRKLRRRRRGRRDPKTTHPRRQPAAIVDGRLTRQSGRAAPVLVQHIAVAQIGDAALRTLPTLGERRGDERLDPEHLEPVADAFEGHALMRRPEKYHAAKPMRPGMTRARAVVHGAACDEAAHAVRDNRELLDRHRPGSEHPLDQISRLAAVLGDMQTAVVAQIHTGTAEIPCEGGAMVVTATLQE